VIEKFVAALFFLIFVCLTGLAGYAIVSAVRSNGEVDYCYTEMWSPPQMAPQFQLYAHRPWRADRMLGVFQTIEEVKVKSDILNCRLQTR
jgi:hypothetical protein